MVKKMKIESRDIDSSIKFNVINRKVTTVTELIALVCAIVYPFRSTGDESCDPQCGQRISKLKSILRQCDKSLKRYSFEGLVNYFHNEFVDGLTTLDKMEFLDIFYGKCRYDIAINEFELTYKDVVARNRNRKNSQELREFNVVYIGIYQICNNKKDPAKS